MADITGDSGLQLTLRVLIDLIVLIIACLPSVIYEFGKIQPIQRGFYCDDATIGFPYHPSTISTSVLIIVGLVIVTGLILVCETAHYCYLSRSKFVFPTKRMLIVKQFNVHSLLYVICSYIWCFGFGAMFNQAWMDIGKFTIGRQRPHFLGTNGCIPDHGLDPCLPGMLVTNYTCLQTDETILKDLRLSFPSGHASLSAYIAVFCICYIQARVPRLPYTYLLKHLVQAIILLMAWFCALSRVADYKHHWSDVLAGIVIGSLAGSFVVKFLCKSFRDPHRHGRFRRMTPQSSYIGLNGVDGSINSPV